jgi:hypothetical protein
MAQLAAPTNFVATQQGYRVGFTWSGGLPQYTAVLQFRETGKEWGTGGFVYNGAADVFPYPFFAINHKSYDYRLQFVDSSLTNDPSNWVEISFTSNFTQVAPDAARARVNADGSIEVPFTGLAHVGGFDNPGWRVRVNTRYVMTPGGTQVADVNGVTVFTLVFYDFEILPTDKIDVLISNPGVILNADNNPTSPFTLTQIANYSEITPKGEFRYATSDDFISDWGSKFAVEWTNLNPSSTIVDLVRLNSAIWWAQDEVDRRLFHSVYAVPLEEMSDGDARLIRDLTNKLALVWLYDHRPGKAVDNEGRPVNVSTPVRKEVDRIFRQITSNQTSLSAKRRVNRPSVVGVQLPL